MFFVKKITHKNVAEVSYLLRPHFQPKIIGGMNEAICFALYCIDTPIGIVYGEKDEVSDNFIIRKLSLADKFKDRKLEELLLKEIESAVAGRNEKQIVFSFLVSESERADYTMNILQEYGWQEPYFVCYLFTINKNILTWKWLNLPLARGMKTCKWSQLDPNIIKQLTRDQKTNDRFPDYLEGYLNKNKFSHEISAALILDSKIIGWMFVEISESDNYIYPYAHVIEEYQRVGKSMPFISLFNETVSTEDHSQDFELIFSVNADNHNMFNAILKQWKPYIKLVYREYHSVKNYD